MNEVQKLQLNILCKLDEVCRKNNIIYYLAYGSCIGAVRHKGFIPWDHDIDVLMHIEDAKKLEHLQNEFGDEYFISSYRTSKDFHATNIRIIDTRHQCIVKKKDKIIEKTNVCIDVYPFYNCPNSKIAITQQVLKSHIYKMLVGGSPQNHGLFVKIISKFILFGYPLKRREKDIRKFENHLNYKGESYEIADYFGEDVTLFNVVTYDKSWFSEPKELEFEGHLFYGPTDTDKYLTKRYGNYMEPTSIAERKNELVYELIKPADNHFGGGTAQLNKNIRCNLFDNYLEVAA